MTPDLIDQDGLKLAAENGPKYLGSLPVVDGIVRGFAQRVAEAYRAWTDGAGDPTAAIEADCARMGDLFLGRDLQGYTPQPWNSDERLGTQLRVVLGSGAKDPGTALFEQLAQCVLSAIINGGEGESDDTLLPQLNGQIGQTVSALLGSPQAV